eukprot:6212022-Pleurochrysis_carterae.AAC.2
MRRRCRPRLASSASVDAVVSERGCERGALVCCGAELRWRQLGQRRTQLAHRRQRRRQHGRRGGSGGCCCGGGAVGGGAVAFVRLGNEAEPLPSHPVLVEHLDRLRRGRAKETRNGAQRGDTAGTRSECMRAWNCGKGCDVAVQSTKATSGARQAIQQGERLRSRAADSQGLWN